ncbi:MAG: hypothetical protein R2748_11350 [Bryobacterales bacterium]
MVELGTNETHNSGDCPNGSNWPSPSNDNWTKGDREEWVSAFDFRDTVFAGNCLGNLNPAPVDPPNNGFSEAAAFLNVRSTQKIFAGSETPGSGLLVTTKTMSWYKDHGRVQ